MLSNDVDDPVDDPGLPRVLAIAWGIEVAPQRGPRRELSHERIVDAAIELADERGLAAVTMQRLATMLGFTTMALYRYVASKDELRALMQDAAIGTVDVPPSDPDDWRRGMRDWAAFLRSRYTAHPWLLDLDPEPVVLLMPGNLRVVDRALELLRPLGLDPGAALDAVSALSLLVRGYASIARDFSARPAVLGDGAVTALVEVVTPERFPSIAPLVASGAYFGGPSPADTDADPDPDPDADLDPWGAGGAFEALLDGLEQRTRR